MLKMNMSMSSVRLNALRKITACRLATACKYPAVQLLVDRVRAGRGDCGLVDADAPIAATISPAA